MIDIEQIIKKIVDGLKSGASELIISGFNYDLPSKNQLLFFFKPECFQFGDTEHIKALIKMVFGKFSGFHIDIAGILLLGGKRLEELSIVDLHYGFINKLSREAGKIVKENELKEMRHALEIDNPDDYTVLGGHEFLKKYPDFDEKALNDFWLSKHSIKLRSGFYFQKYTVNNRKFILINGFHPLQIRRYTHPEQRIVVLLIHSDTDWKSLKRNLAGDTYPERAKKESIRGELFDHHLNYGVPLVDISNNCVHLSAGPFEALFEIDNFLKNIEGAGFDLIKTNIGRRMNEKNLPLAEIIRSLSNPIAHIDGSNIDLDTFTEEKNTPEALSDYTRYFLPPS